MVHLDEGAWKEYVSFPEHPVATKENLAALSP
jgi:hypothetical protein